MLLYSVFSGYFISLLMKMEASSLMIIYDLA